jgi:hypothetical protein
VSRSPKSKRYNRPSALKHGAFSSSAFFPWENRAEFEALHLELIDEWDPNGAFEEEAVFTIASCMWKKRRIQEKRQLEVLTHLRTPDPQSSKEPTPFFRGVIVVVFVTSGKEAVSVISMRPASKNERKLYAER